jgi:pre-mRNA-splicing factor SYF1
MDNFERDVANNPYRLKSWTNYLAFLDSSDSYQRYKVYERALKYLPRSFKLWFAYLDERNRNLRGFSVNDKGYDILINTYKRALVHLHKMPKIW